MRLSEPGDVRGALLWPPGRRLWARPGWLGQGGTDHTTDDLSSLRPGTPSPHRSTFPVLLPRPQGLRWTLQGPLTSSHPPTSKDFKRTIEKRRTRGRRVPAIQLQLTLAP